MKVEIFIDTICGWCFVGINRLNLALKKIDKPCEILYTPFLLNPSMPEQGLSRDSYLVNKFGSADIAKPMYDSMVLEAKRDNLYFNLEKITRTPNTVLSHILIDVAKRYHLQDKVLIEIFNNYFIQGIDIGDINNLLKIGANHGIKSEELIREFKSENNKTKIKKMDEIGRKMGINGVPFYIFNEKVLLAGAQPVDALVQALEESK